MALKLRIGLIIFSLLVIIVTTHFVRKNDLSIKYSLIWYLAGLLIGIIAILPNAFIYLATLVGFETMSNMLIGVFIGLLLLITLVTTIITTHQKKKIILLVQEISILKKEVEKLKNKE